MWRQLAALVLALGVGLADISARGGGGCVAAGTLIDTPDGPRTVDSLQVGASVWSLQAGQRIRASVQAVYAVKPAEYIELATEGGTLRLTAEHPVQTAVGVFTRADALTGQSVLFTTAARTRLIGLSRIPADQPAYNMLVSPGGVFGPTVSWCIIRAVSSPIHPSRWRMGASVPSVQSSPAIRCWLSPPTECPSPPRYGAC